MIVNSTALFSTLSPACTTAAPTSPSVSRSAPAQPSPQWSVEIDDWNDRPVVGLAVGADSMKGVAYAGALYMSGLRVKLIDASRWHVTQGLLPSPVMAALSALHGLDGIVFTGGGDIDPRLQGRADIDPTNSGVLTVRDQFELETCRRAIDDSLPVLGICRGMQLINVSQGGTLFQDIDRDVAPLQTAKGHRQIDRGLAKSEVGHAIDITPGSRLAEMFGTTRLGVNSDHHQAVLEPGAGLHVTARAEDGVAEAVEATDPEHFVLGVQFHPELMYARDAAFLAPFAAFADAVRAHVDQRKG